MSLPNSFSENVIVFTNRGKTLSYVQAKSVTGKEKRKDEIKHPSVTSAAIDLSKQQVPFLPLRIQLLIVD